MTGYLIEGLTIGLGFFLAELAMYIIRNVMSYFAIKRYYRKQDEFYAKMGSRPSTRGLEDFGDDESTTVN